MTKKEAIKRLKEIDIRDALQEDYDALYMAIEALEQERSRLAQITQYRNDCEKLMQENEQLKKALKQEPRTGRWLKHPTEEDYSVCSRCGIGCRRKEHGKNADGTKYIDIYSYRFCPYCGARMEGEV